MYTPARFLPPTLLTLASVVLSGCAMGVTSSGTVAGSAMQGSVMGGQQPVSGATVQLYATSSAGYGAASIAKLTSAVTTDANGFFTLTGLYTCPSADAPMYLVASGGNPGLGGNVNNTAIALMAALGPCGNLTPSTHISLNELTTVAGVWALAPFMTSVDHVGTSPTNTAGLTNAFTMAANLASTARGASPGDIPVGALVPSTELNALGNILAECVNTAGGSANDGTPCGNLFALATPTSGIAPTNTIEAALDIALNPAHNAAAIFALATPTGPFQPALTAAPNDFTIAVNFPIGTRTTSAMAFDSTGNLWVASAEALVELNPAGAQINSFPALAGNNVAIDATGNIWVTTAVNTLGKMPPTLSAPVFYGAPTPPAIGADGLALDGFGNAWYTCDFCSAVYKLDPSGNYLGGYAVTGSQQTNLSIDPSENVWLGNYDYAKVNVFSNSGTPLANSPLNCGTCGNAAFVANDAAGNAWVTGYNLARVTPTGSYSNYDVVGGIFSPVAVAIDGAGNAWVTNPVALSNVAPGSVSEFTNSGTAVTPAFGYLSDTLATPLSIAVDGSGSIWLRNTGTKTVTALVGAGVPVVTPLALGVKNGTLGSKP